MTNAKLITKQTAQGERYAVQFAKDGLSYQTLFTASRLEACAWGRNVQTHGWAVEGRPLKIGA